MIARCSPKILWLWTCATYSGTSYSQVNRWFTFSWRINDQPAGYLVGVVLGGERAEQVILVYRHRQGMGQWEDVCYSVPLTWTGCNYGGSRPWWQCPGCQRRAAILYHGGRLFLCRRCLDLAYASQRETDRDRMRRRQEKIRERLGQTLGGVAAPFPAIPKGMHEKTYERLRALAGASESKYDSAMTHYLDSARQSIGRKLRQ